jgi:hypothetical protein
MKILSPIIFLISSLNLFAELKFDSPVIKAEADHKTKTITREYRFKNIGTKTVTITQADAGCSCLAAEVANGKLEYAAGEEGVLRATFEIGNLQGLVGKTIHIWLKGDAEESPSTSVQLHVHIPVIINLAPKTVNWVSGEDVVPKLIEVKIEHDKPVHVTKTESSSEMFSTKILTVEKGKHYQIEVTPKGADQVGLSIIRIETDLDVESQRIQQGFAVIRKAQQ